jgi:hypothetical protein
MNVLTILFFAGAIGSAVAGVELLAGSKEHIHQHGFFGSLIMAASGLAGVALSEDSDFNIVLMVGVLLAACMGIMYAFMRRAYMKARRLATA